MEQVYQSPLSNIYTLKTIGVGVAIGIGVGL